MGVRAIIPSPMGGQTSAPGRGTLTRFIAYFTPILAAICIALAAFAWFNQLSPPPALSDDGVRDQLLVRDCTDLGRCHLIGPPSSLAGFHHGAVWLDLLIAVRVLGGDVAAERNVVIALIAVSIATLFVVVWRWLRPGIALPAAMLFATAVTLDNPPNSLTSPNVSAFGDLLTAAGLLCYGLSGQRRFLIAAAFALSVTMNLHAGSLTLAAPLVMIAVLVRPRPWREMLIAAAVFVGTSLLAASAALRANLIALATHHLLLPVLATGLLLVPLLARLSPGFRRLPWGVRAWLIGFLLILPFTVAALWLVFSQEHHFSPMYLHPILAPAAVVLAATLCLPFEIAARRLRVLRWIPSVALLSAGAFAGGQVLARSATIGLSSGPHDWTLAEARTLAATVARRGWTYEDLIFHLQAPRCRELLAGLAIAAPQPGVAAREDGRQLQVVKVAGDVCDGMAGPDDCIRFGSTTSAIVRDVDSWLRPRFSRACRMPFDASGSPQCSRATFLPAELRSPERFLFISRSFPETHALDLAPPYTATYEIPVAPRVGETRDLMIADADTDAGWRITRVDGVRVEGSMPSGRVRLHADSGNAALVVLEKPFVERTSTGDIDRRYPPCLFELAPGDPLESSVAVQ